MTNLKNSRENQSSPKILQSITGLPTRNIFCGSYHSGVWTQSGTLFVWGRNSSGQLGTGDQTDSLAPKLIKSIRGQKVSHVTAGDEHTVALTADGGIFAWGDGKNGQNGHGRALIQNTPRK